MQVGKEEFLNQAEQVLADDSERLQEYIQALDCLAEVLDEESIFDQYHPLQAELGNFAPMSVKRVATFVEMIKTFERDTTFQDDILPRLNRPRQYPSARLELEIAYFIRNAETSVEFVDPKAEHGQQQQDLLVADSIPIEIKQLRQPRHIGEQSKYFNEIQNAVYRGGAPSKFRRAGRIHRALAKPEKEEFINRIEDAIPRVKNGEAVEIRETSLGEVDYEMFLAPQEKEGEIETWMEEHDVDGPLAGPPQTKNDILRLKRSIAEKVEQLPEDTPGVVLIEVDPWITLDERTENLLGIVRELLKDVYDHEELVSVVLLIRASYIDAEPIDFSAENVRIADFETHSEFGWRTFVTIHNKFTEDPNGKALIDSLFTHST